MDFKEFIKNNVDTLNNTTIFIRYSDNPGNQVSLYYKESYGILYNIEISYYENFYKVKSESKRISPFGDVWEIVYYTSNKFLNDLVLFGENKKLIIGITSSINFPIKFEELEIQHDRSYSDNNVDECPICKNPWTTDLKIKLKCNHLICRDCLFSLISHNSENCPICRSKLIPE